MSSRVRIAIDGCGTLTQETILPHLCEPDFRARAEVVALADVVPGRARALADVWGVPDAYYSYEAMLAAADVDAVLIIVPSVFHAEHARMAMEAGRDVYVQKPLAVRWSDAEALLETHCATGRRAVAAPTQYLWPLFEAMRRRLGELGPLYFAQPPLLGWGGRELEFPFHPGWFFSKTGGPLRDHGGYGLGTLTTLFGPVQRVTAFSGVTTPERAWRGEAFPVEGDDNSVALLDFGKNLYASLHDAWCHSSPGVRSLRVLGLEGTLETDPRTANDLTIFPFGGKVFRRTGEIEEIPFAPERVPCLEGRHESLGHVHVYSDILHLTECIRHGCDPGPSLAQAAHSAEVFEAAFRAAETGCVQVVRSRFPEPPPIASFPWMAEC